MTERLYHLFMKNEDGLFEQVEGIYNDDDRRQLHSVLWTQGISPQFRIIPDSQLSSTETRPESDAESLREGDNPD